MQTVKFVQSMQCEVQAGAYAVPLSKYPPFGKQLVPFKYLFSVELQSVQAG